MLNPLRNPPCRNPLTPRWGLHDRSTYLRPGARPARSVRTRRPARPPARSAPRLARSALGERLGLLGSAPARCARRPARPHSLGAGPLARRAARSARPARLGEARSRHRVAEVPAPGPAAVTAPRGPGRCSACARRRVRLVGAENMRATCFRKRVRACFLHAQRGCPRSDGPPPPPHDDRQHTNRPVTPKPAKPP